MNVRTPRCLIWWLALSVLGGAGSTVAAETVFLQNGRTIQADKVEIRGDVVRIEKPAETIELPRSEVLTIHPSPAPRVPSRPADVYRDLTQQMNDKVRREIQEQPTGKSIH